MTLAPDVESALELVASHRALSISQLAALNWPELSDRWAREQVYRLLSTGLLKQALVPGTYHQLVTVAPRAWTRSRRLKHRRSRHVTDRPSDGLLARGYLRAALRIALVADRFRIDDGERGWCAFMRDLILRQSAFAKHASGPKRFLAENTLRHLETMARGERVLPLPFDVAWSKAQTFAVFVEHPHRALERQLDEILPALPECVPVYVIARAADDGTAYDPVGKRHVRTGPRHARLVSTLCSLAGASSARRSPTVLVDYRPDLSFRTVHRSSDRKKEHHAKL